MKNNILFGISAIIMALSVGYYFGFYLPYKISTEDLFSKKQYCENAGRKYLAQETKDRNYTESGISSITGNGQFTYSQELTTCLYANTISTYSSEILKTEYYVIDLTTNNKLASWVRWDKGCDECLSNPESAKMRAEYTAVYNKNFLSK